MICQNKLELFLLVCYLRHYDTISHSKEITSHISMLLINLVSSFGPVHQSCVNKFGNKQFIQVYNGYGYNGSYAASAKKFDCDRSNSLLLHWIFDFVSDDEDNSVVIDRLGYFGLDFLSGSTLKYTISNSTDTKDYEQETDRYGDISVELQNNQDMPLAIHSKDTRDVFYELSNDYLVITDMDDTIKRSYISDIREALVELFKREFKPFDIINTKYLGWKNTDFVYLSAGFNQIYPLMKNFIQKYFPPGPIILRTVKLYQYLYEENRILVPYGFKLAKAQQVLDKSLSQQVVLIGDSTEVDAYVYASLYAMNNYKHRICKIYIRIVLDSQLEAVEHYLENVPKHKVRLFKNGDELPESLESECSSKK